MKHKIIRIQGEEVDLKTYREKRREKMQDCVRLRETLPLTGGEGAVYGWNGVGGCDKKGKGRERERPEIMM